MNFRNFGGPRVRISIPNSGGPRQSGGNRGEAGGVTAPAGAPRVESAVKPSTVTAPACASRVPPSRGGPGSVPYTTERSVSNFSTADALARVRPAKTTASGPGLPSITLAASAQERLAVVQEARPALGPPYLLGALLYDGRSPLLAEYFSHNRILLGSATGDLIALLGIGYPSQDETFESMMSRALAKLAVAQREMYQRLLHELGSASAVAIDGTAQLIELFGVKEDDLPCIVLSTFPRAPLDAILRIPLSVPDAYYGLRQLTESIATGLAATRMSEILVPGKSNVELINAVQPTLWELERQLGLVAEPVERMLANGWSRYPRLGNIECDSDFTNVAVHGKTHTFNARQAHAVGKLVRKSTHGIASLKQSELLEGMEPCPESLRDAFKGHPAWGTLIVPDPDAPVGSYMLSV